MMNRLIRAAALALSAALLVTLFAGCGKKTEEPPAIEETSITASPVTFSRSGSYTTTVTSEDADFSGVTAENTEITYYDYDMARTLVGIEEEAGDSEAYKTVKIGGVKVSDGSVEIAFTDDTAAKQLKDQYTVEFKDLDTLYTIPVEYPEMSLACDLASVKASDEGAKLELTLDGGRFSGDLDKDDVGLANAFAEMEIESAKASGNKLVLELSGAPAKNKEINAMEWGTVTVKASGIEDGYRDVSAAVDIEKECCGIDAESLKFADGKVTADIYSYGGEDVTALTEKDIAIDGVRTESVTKKDGSTVTVTFSAGGIESVSDFVVLVNGRELTLGDMKKAVYIPVPGFRPFFDYCDEVGGDLQFTLILLSEGGTFAKDLSEKNVRLGGDFVDAKIVSLDRRNDTSAELIITVPSGGRTAENYSCFAEVALEAGSLISEWGEAGEAAEEISCFREYSGQTLGRGDVTLNKETLLEIQKYTRGQNTTFGQILYWGNNIYQTYAFGKAVLETLGVVKSEHQELMDSLNEINEKLDDITKMLKNQAVEFEHLESDLYVQNLQPYFENMNKMMNAYEGMRALYMNACDDAKNIYGVIIDPATASEQEITEYNDLLTDIIVSGSKEPGNMRYTSYSTNFSNLYSSFQAVTGAFIRDDPNPLPDPNDIYDQFCSLEYNFDSQAYYPRIIFREYAVANMEKVMGLFHVYYKTSSDPNNHDFILLDNKFQQAVAIIDANAPAGHAPEDIKANNGYQTTYNQSFISDVKVIGADEKSAAENLKSQAVADGYTVIDQDLNQDAGGHYIYICYKTTEDYNDAIKDIIIRKGKGNNSDTYSYNDHTYYLASYDGDAEFKRGKGDLNEESGGAYLFIYYTKELSSYDPAYGKAKTAVGKLYVNNVDNGQNLNENGDYLWLHADKCGEEGFPVVNTKVYVDNDPEYYPYCYTFGKKMCVMNSVDYEKYNDYLFETEPAFKWSDDALNLFKGRMRTSSVSEEFESAGIKMDYPLAVKLSVDHVTERIGGTIMRTRDDVKGNLILLGENKVTKDVKLGKIYTSFTHRSHKYADERYQEFCVAALV